MGKRTDRAGARGRRLRAGWTKYRKPEFTAIARTLLLGAPLAISAICTSGAVAEEAGQNAVPPAIVTAAVRNGLGQLKWVVTEPADYTPLEAAGRKLYTEARCWYCHSQYAPAQADAANRWAPISEDKRRWGLPVEPGEYAYDNPFLPGTQGIAPDLAREGLKYGDEWHLAHFYNPPSVVKRSIMGGFSGLFDSSPGLVKIVDDASGAHTLEKSADTERFFDFTSKDQVKLTPNENGLLFVPLTARGKYPLVWTPNSEYAGETVKLVAETDDVHALVAYVQKLGMNRGRWREFVEPSDTELPDVTIARTDEGMTRGKAVYERRCIGCHGSKGDGNGEAATFLYRQRPRNFTGGVFKFRLNKGNLPSDRDLLRTISRGVRGTAMPPWYELPLEDRLAVIQYIKFELAADRSDAQKPYLYFVEEPPPPPAQSGLPPKPSAELIRHGGEVWQAAKCWECHGKGGRGDGEKAAGLKDDWGFPIRPANLVSGQFKSGPAVTDIFRTITFGLSGSPMPSFQDAFPEPERWALAYYVLSLSAFSDPLTGAPLPITLADRLALDDPDLETAGPAQAYKPQAISGLKAEAPGNKTTATASAEERSR